MIRHQAKGVDFEIQKIAVFPEIFKEFHPVTVTDKTIIPGIGSGDYMEKRMG